MEILSQVVGLVLFIVVAYGMVYMVAKKKGWEIAEKMKFW